MGLGFCGFLAGFWLPGDVGTWVCVAASFVVVIPEIPFASLSFGTVFIWDDFLGDGVFIY